MNDVTVLDVRICGGVLHIEQPGRLGGFDLDDSYEPFVQPSQETPRFRADVRVEFGRPIASEAECLHAWEYSRVYAEDDGFVFNTIPRTPTATWDSLDRVIACSRDFLDVHLLRDGDILPPSMYPLYDLSDRQLLGSILPSIDLGFLVHSSAVRVDGAGVLFLGHCGKGKSTMSRIWNGSGSGLVLSDECNGICRDGSSWHLYGTPWPSSALCFANESAPLKAAFFLEHGPENRIERISAEEAFMGIMEQAFVPYWSKPATDSLLAMLDGLTSEIPFNRLWFRPDEDVISTITGHLGL